MQLRLKCWCAPITTTLGLSSGMHKSSIDIQQTIAVVLETVVISYKRASSGSKEKPNEITLVSCAILDHVPESLRYKDVPSFR